MYNLQVGLFHFEAQRLIQGPALFSSPLERLVSEIIAKHSQMLL